MSAANTEKKRVRHQSSPNNKVRKDSSIGRVIDTCKSENKKNKTKTKKKKK
jgi:hypothetical protein